MKDVVNIDGVELMGYTSLGCIDLVSASTGEMKNPKIEFCAFTEGKWMRIEAVAGRKEKQEVKTAMLNSQLGWWS